MSFKDFFKRSVNANKGDTAKVSPFSVDEKEKIAELNKEQMECLKKVESIDKKILAIQRSTKTLMPQFSPMHNYLRMRWKWYYNWHSMSWSGPIHWSVLTFYIVAMIIFIPSTFMTQPKLALAGPGTCSFAGGTGAVGDPYQISTLDCLQAMGASVENLTKSYILVTDIVATDTATWNNGDGFTPIGYNYNGPATSFTGNFDGQHYTISDLTIINTGTSNAAIAALFGWVGGDYGWPTTTTIKDVNLVNVNVDSTVAGSLVGWSFGNLVLTGNSVSGTVDSAAGVAGGLIGDLDTDTADISGNTSAATVTGFNFAGGLIGYNTTSPSNIANNSVSGDVTTGDVSYPDYGAAGGLISQDYYASTYTGNFTTGKITGGSGAKIGGFIGEDHGATFANNYSTGVVEANGYAGGFAGFSENSTFANNYSSGNVIGNTGTSVGGFAGQTNTATFTNNYSIGAVTGSGEDVAGFIGYNGGDTLATNFYLKTDNINTSLFGTSGGDVADGVVGKDNTQMKQSATFVSWDFSTTPVWTIAEGADYPRFVWQEPSVATHSITTTVVDGNGTISPTSLSNIEDGSSQSFTITPDSGYYIGEIKIDGVTQVDLPSTYPFTDVTADHTITVLFVADNTRIWDGGGADNNWNTDANWTGNTAPTATDDVIFNTTSTKTSAIDADFAGTIKSLSINSGYTNTVSASRELTITGDVNLAAGTFAPGNQTINVAGSWNNTGGTFTAGTSTVNFNGSTAGKTINTGGTGDGKDFYNMTVAGQAAPETGLVGYWKMDDNTTNSTVTDINPGAKNNGTLYSGGSPVNTNTKSTTGKFGSNSAMSFNGSSNYVDFGNPSNLNFGTSSATISAWVYLPPADSNYHTVIAKRVNTNFTGWSMYRSPNQNYLRAELASAHLGPYYDVASPSLSIDSWHNIVLTIDKNTNTLTMYGDGIAGTPISISGLDSITNPTNLFIGYEPSSVGSYWNNSIDDTRIYNRALSATEIQNLYSLNTSSPTGSYVLSSAISATNNLSVSSGTLDASGYDVTAGNIIQSGGTFTAPTSGMTFTVNGGWNHSSGTFTSGTGTVIFTGDALVQGDTTFNNFTAQTGGKTLTFADSSTQTITGAMKLTGTSGNLVALRSSTTGTQWKVNPTTADVSYVDVKDSNNTNATAITANYSNDSLNNTNWTIPGLSPIPV